MLQDNKNLEQSRIELQDRIEKRNGPTLFHLANFYTIQFLFSISCMCPILDISCELSKIKIDVLYDLQLMGSRRENSGWFNANFKLKYSPL